MVRRRRRKNNEEQEADFTFCLKSRLFWANLGAHLFQAAELLRESEREREREREREGAIFFCEKWADCLGVDASLYADCSSVAPIFFGKMGRLPRCECFLCMLIAIRLVVLCMGLLGGEGAGGWGSEHGALTV